GGLSTVDYASLKPFTLIPFASANTNALTVAVVDGSGSQITAFGGGTQYIDGGTPPAHPTGDVLIYDNGSSVWQSVNSTHGLPVNILNSSLAVTGTFYQATQPVSIATMPSTPVTGTFWQTTQPVSGTFWQTTQPVSAASLPLPSGAATAAKQPSLGTAGSPSADVITVQGITSMTALKTDGSGVTQPVSGTFWQATQPVSGTFWQATQPVSGTFYQATQPVSIADGSGVVKQSATLPITPIRVAIAASSSGDNTLIAAVSSKKIYVYAFELSFSGAVNAKFTDGASGTNLGGLYYGATNSGAANAVTPPNYLFAGSTNTALILNLSAGTSVGGAISYWTV
ncbi:MAG: hypothetical protein ACREQ5_23680, partial [Candidatus Dormibacteria bacterium]